MVVDQFDVLRVAIGPDEADSPLVADADAVLAFRGHRIAARVGYPGGTRRSLIFPAASISCSLLRARLASSRLIRLVTVRFQTAAVSLSLNERITPSNANVARY